MKKEHLKKLGICTLLFLSISTMIAQKKEVSIKESQIDWKGKKILGSHYGKIQLKEGILIFDNNQLIGGNFVIDMHSIIVEDLKGNSKNKLENHLKSDDFFGVDNFPTSTLEIEKTLKTNDGYLISALITIKNTTQPISFTLLMKENEAHTNLKIDRTKFNIRYGSGSFFDNLGDNTIYDDFELDVRLKF